jgi:hypothetical protein
MITLYQENMQTWRRADLSVERELGRRGWTYEDQSAFHVGGWAHDQAGIRVNTAEQARRIEAYRDGFKWNGEPL